MKIDQSKSPKPINDEEQMSGKSNENNLLQFYC